MERVVPALGRPVRYTQLYLTEHVRLSQHWPKGMWGWWPLCRCILIDNMSAFYYLDEVGKGSVRGHNPVLGVHDVTR